MSSSVFCCREPFVFDCSTAEKKPKHAKEDNSDGGASEETGSDKVLAFTVSTSGKLVALTDDSKRLVLFRCEPSWQCISIRWVVRRCTSLMFSQAEDKLLVTDKSGDVYSFSVVEPQRDGELKMGHLSMLLALSLSPDDKYIITADRDEKIRVSHLRSPYNIQSFCLGHQQFVSALLDGTMKLWEYESGRKLQSWDLKELAETPSKQKNPTVCRIASSPDARHVAVQCERVSTVQFFTLDQEGEDKLVPHSSLSLPHCPLDMTFDPEGRLWVLMDSSDAPLQIYTHKQDFWEVQSSARTDSRFEHLYKVSFDNVTAYLQKKQQRVEEQQLKRGMAQKANGNKKAKKEMSGAASGSKLEKMLQSGWDKIWKATAQWWFSRGEMSQASPLLYTPRSPHHLILCPLSFSQSPSELSLFPPP
ncbi:hypothetical protein FQN60_001652, partial [Etheostoma spectabile]